MANRLKRRNYEIPRSLREQTDAATALTGERISHYGARAIHLLHDVNRARVTPLHHRLVVAAVEIPLPALSTTLSYTESSRLQLQLEDITLNVLQTDAEKRGMTEKQRLVQSLVFQNFVIEHCLHQPPSFVNQQDGTVVRFL